MKRFALLSVTALCLTACGSGSGVAATATEGDAFCTLAEVANDDNDTLDSIDVFDRAKVELELGAAIDSLSAAAAKAPKDIAETVKELLSKEEEFEALLKANGYDFVQMSESDEGKKLIDEAENSTTGDEFDAYISDKCGIDTSDTTTPDTTPVDTVATGDTSVDTIVDLGEGEAAINKFLDFYELGTGAELTSDERSCIVSELVDSVTGAELNQAVAGQASEELQQALGLAFIGCDVAVQS
ncbi:MAG: hypothetical protein M3P52_08905 [Actinomycetota bacterium]|nr:hypothetical protein [Actinomycetota bacterium]